MTQESLEKLFDRRHKYDGKGDRSILVAWQICDHAILSADHYDEECVAPHGQLRAFYNAESSTA
eukprot:3202750-Lingulodinium_polyedra.AAC.1